MPRTPLSLYVSFTPERSHWPSMRPYALPVALAGVLLKRLLIGRALRTEAQHVELLPKWIALPVFCSDPISSVAYATEQILLVAGLGGAHTCLWPPRSRWQWWRC